MVARSALVTGGSSGIGLATAHVLHAAGWDVTLASRRPDALARAAAGFDRPVATHAADLAAPGAPAAAVAAHVDRCGGIDALVHASGTYELDDVRDLTAERWDATADLHVRAAVLAAGAAATRMTAAGRGRIVLLSSVNGYHSEPASIAYSAAKASIVSIARSLAVDLARAGVQANAVAPGWVRTPMTEQHLDATTPEQLLRVNPSGRAGTAEEIAAVVGWLVLDAPDFLTGATIVVDGGQTALAPMP